MKTEPDRASRPAKARRLPGKETVALILIMLVAAAWRLWHIDFGLPALNDPDEPLFVTTALDMLREHRLNPEWFGHPATILFYALAAIFAVIGYVGTLTGQWADTAGYVSAVYADPGIVILPMRLFIMTTGLGCIYLIYRVGREAAGSAAGLIAAALLACNGLHIELSQVIRTDMIASLFMLGSCLFTLRAASTGRMRHHMLAGIMLGLGGATKWPSLLFIVNAPGAILYRWRQDGWRRCLILLPVAIACAIVALCLASPYLLLDHATVLRDLGGEARTAHPGSTGGTAMENMLWYARHVVLNGFGPVGAILATMGLALAPWRARRLALAALPGAALFFAGIAFQALIWERWAVPLLPWIAIAIAIALVTLVGKLREKWQPAAMAIMLAALLFPMASGSASRTRMRAHDTRQMASQWVREHVPAGKSLLIEDAAFDLLKWNGRVLFPLGDAGCVDVHRLLGAKPSYQQIGEKRSGKAIVDLGNVAPQKLASCNSDVAIITHYDRYRREAGTFPDELAQYDALMRNGHILATFRPIAGLQGGPDTYVVQRNGPSTGR
ncbi:ArnT family glycosyltransferase [Sphingobium sp.]|uniref:ArnT family glycosyltransferase n=1 Tax=Sphingobium sp. TaxID=1912891 RepID=UPI003B3A5BE3